MSRLLCLRAFTEYKAEGYWWEFPFTMNCCLNETRKSEANTDHVVTQQAKLFAYEAYVCTWKRICFAWIRRNNIFERRELALPIQPNKEIQMEINILCSEESLVTLVRSLMYRVDERRKWNQVEKLLHSNHKGFIEPTSKRRPLEALQAELNKP